MDKQDTAMMQRVRAGLNLTHSAVQVSCGPYHSAAVTSSGALFTWGDGLCGKLGHGDQQSISEPRQVCTTPAHISMPGCMHPAILMTGEMYHDRPTVTAVG